MPSPSPSRFVAAPLARVSVPALAFGLATASVPAVSVDEAPIPRAQAASSQAGEPAARTQRRVEVPGEDGLVVLVERASGGLVLDADSAQFPRLGLEATDPRERSPSDPLNGGRSFGAISRWDAGDEALWAVWIDAPCTLALEPLIEEGSGESGEAGREGAREARRDPAGSARFMLRVGDEARAFPSNDPASGRLVHRFAEAGLHEVRLACVAPARRAGEAGVSPKVLGIRVRDGGDPRGGAAGDATDAVGVVRIRWRPAATHARFRAPTLATGARLWIMELEAEPGLQGFYAPVTTPFGYYGSTWSADGTVRPGINFSLWSFGRGEPEPPVDRLSHLLAIGSPEASFGGFDHEGTGVKPRGWEPLAPVARQAYALRVEPGDPFDTFHAYFLDAASGEWRFYASGRKLANPKRPITHLLPGTFVEVPGPPHVQRTGSVTRTIRCRGWVSEDGVAWHRLSEMSGGDVDRETGLTHTVRAADGDWFVLGTGGWYQRPGSKEPTVLAVPEGDRPAWLSPERTAALRELPASVRIVRAVRLADVLELEVEVQGAGTGAALDCHWGADDGVTFASRWPHRDSIPLPGDGVQTVRIPLPGDARDAGFARVLLRGARGQFWSLETVRVEQALVGATRRPGA